MKATKWTPTRGFHVQMFLCRYYMPFQKWSFLRVRHLTTNIHLLLPFAPLSLQILEVKHVCLWIICWQEKYCIRAIKNNLYKRISLGKFIEKIVNKLNSFLKRISIYVNRFLCDKKGVLQAIRSICYLYNVYYISYI